MQGGIVIIVEVINILNLAQIEGIFDIIKDYVALEIISQFDDCFFQLYGGTHYVALSECSLPVENFSRDKKIFDNNVAQDDFNMHSKVINKFE